MLKLELNLKKACLVKIATVLWQQEDLFDTDVFVDRMHHRPNYEVRTIPREESDLFERVLAKVEHLRLVSTLNPEVRQMVITVGHALLDCLKHVTGDLRIGDYAVKWTNHGTIDYEAMARRWVDDTSFVNIDRRFELACYYCMEDNVARIWARLPWGLKNQHMINSRNKNSRNVFVDYWVGEAADHERGSSEVNMVGVELEMVKTVPVSIATMMTEAVKERNLAAMRYFWPKVDQMDKGRLLEMVAEECHTMYSYRGHGLCEFVIGLELFERAEFIDKYPNELMSLFVYNWPWSSYAWQLFERYGIETKKVPLFAKTLFKGYYRDAEYTSDIKSNRYYNFLKQLILLNNWDGILQILLYFADFAFIDNLLNDSDLKSYRANFLRYDQGKFLDFDRFEKVRLNACNVEDCYLFWSLHEPNDHYNILWQLLMHGFFGPAGYFIKWVYRDKVARRTFLEECKTKMTERMRLLLIDPPEWWPREYVRQRVRAIHEWYERGEGWPFGRKRKRIGEAASLSG